MSDVYKDNWVWYVPSDAAAHAANIAESMGPAAPGVRRRVLIKAGGDGGGIWDQWSPARLQPYLDLGLEPIPWVYTHPFNNAEVPAMLQTLAKFSAKEVIINTEVEWGYSNGITDDYVARWCDTALSSLDHEVPGIEMGFSSVPSWTWFPYAAFSQHCTGTEQPQCYFHQWVADQAEPSRLKSRIGAKVVVGLPATQAEDSGGQGETWTDQKIMDLADYYAMGMRDLAGFNGWQSGSVGPGLIARMDFGFRAMAYAYNLLPQFAAPVTPPQPAGLALPYNVRAEGDVWHCYVPDGSLDTWVVQKEFIDFYLKYPDALQLFGLPVSGMGPNEAGILTQYFERARFELQGSNVLLGRVGSELLEARNQARKIELVGHGQVSAMGVAA